MLNETTETVKVWKLWQDGNSYVVSENALDGIMEELRYAEAGDEFRVTVEEMDRAEFEALPEFDGF